MSSPIYTAVLPTIIAAWEALVPTFDGQRTFHFAEDLDLTEGASGHRCFEWTDFEGTSEHAHGPDCKMVDYKWAAELWLDHRGFSGTEATRRALEDGHQLRAAIEDMAGTWPNGVREVYCEGVRTETIDDLKRVRISLRATVEET